MARAATQVSASRVAALFSNSLGRGRAATEQIRGIGESASIEAL